MTVHQLPVLSANTALQVKKPCLSARGSVCVSSWDALPLSLWLNKVDLGFLMKPCFRENVFSRKRPVFQLPEMKVSLFAIMQTTSDKDIRSELGDHCEFRNPDVFSVFLARLAMLDKEHEADFLLKNGKANFFYVRSRSGRSMVAHLSWRVSFRIAGVTPLHERKWHADHQVIACG